MVISKHRWIIILTVCLVLLLSGYYCVRSVRPGQWTYGILQTSADYLVQEDLK